MNQNHYDLATAEALMKFAYPGYGEQDLSPYEIKEDGVYVTETFRDISPSGTVFDWTPADEMEWPGSPNPNTAPFLPIPFQAAQLAAAMIDGAGYQIQGAVGHRIGYPLGNHVLEGVFSARTRWARDALTQAYALAAAAQLVVGEFDHEQEARAHAMAQQYEEANKQANDREGVFEQGITTNEARARRARAVESISDLKDRLHREQAAVAENWKAWRKAMVRQLLNPVFSMPELSEADCKAEDGEFTAGFYDVHLNLGNWAALSDVKPNEAAMLLCGYDPDKDPPHTAKDFVMLARRFSDYAQQYPAPRRLAQWWTLALEWMRAKGLGFITLNRDLGDALIIFDMQHHPRTASGPAQPAESDSTPAAAPLVDSASNAPLPLTTSDIAFSFDGIRWSEKEWRTPLGNKPKWLQGCVVIPGRRGVSETRWNPVLIAAWLVSNGHTQARSARSRFQTKPQLIPWLEAWKTYEADNFETP